MKVMTHAKIREAAFGMLLLVILTLTMLICGFKDMSHPNACSYLMLMQHCCSRFLEVMHI